MVYKYVSSKRIIDVLYDEGVKTTDWEGRISGWCLKALKSLNCMRVLWDMPVTVMVKDYKIRVPDELDSIRSIEINKQKMYELRKSRPIEREESMYLRSYNISNGNINFAFTDKEVTINGTFYPLDFEPTLGVYFPLYPDLNEVEDYLKFYCLRRIILRGYIHPMYSFNILNNTTNINIITEDARKAAKRSVNAMNAEQRRRISDTLVRMDVSPNIDVNRLFY